ncbi:carboxymuconolactone decarboxylase family protein [Mucilaginibacter sabulilitoris]|uniref:Carboxymuconolactone decarboxylase family protein n=1 Tax=Mucilaginibacter sabulilitoris TaxID=1173583 RepID=A0ABZ0TSN6_9SPHI|nr:carboxymuconolactone decarboxylase family protein [Mucilaginibacter sabulilitoris]WPU94774.1 carboxymuconolactone decarboxylase family protein [Mucilaginibacter sabulilitoris]
MRQFPLIKYAEVSAVNRKYFDHFNNKLGSIPNLYGMLAHSEQALDAYYSLHHHALSLNTIERVIVGIVVASLNNSPYCLDSHIMVGKLNGLSNEEINQIVEGTIIFNERYHFLANLVTEIVVGKGRPREQTVQRFLEAGYTVENMVDMIVCVADTTFTNFLTCSMGVPLDIPGGNENHA